MSAPVKTKDLAGVTSLDPSTLRALHSLQPQPLKLMMELLADGENFHHLKTFLEAGLAPAGGPNVGLAIARGGAEGSGRRRSRREDKSRAELAATWMASVAEAIERTEKRPSHQTHALHTVVADVRALQDLAAVRDLAFLEDRVDPNGSDPVTSPLVTRGVGEIGAMLGKRVGSLTVRGVLALAMEENPAGRIVALRPSGNTTRHDMTLGYFEDGSPLGVVELLAGLSQRLTSSGPTLAQCVDPTNEDIKARGRAAVGTMLRNRYFSVATGVVYFLRDGIWPEPSVWHEKRDGQTLVTCNTDGRSGAPRDVACMAILMDHTEKQCLAVLRGLHAAGVNLLEADLAGRTPLHMAARRHFSEAFAFLEDLGADPQACDNQGRNAWAWARTQGVAPADGAEFEALARAYRARRAVQRALAARPHPAPK